MTDQKQAPKLGAPLDAYAAHVLAREAHEANEERERQADAQALTDVYALIRSVAGKGEMRAVWPNLRTADWDRRRQHVVKELRRAGYRVTGGSDGVLIEWLNAPPQPAEVLS